MIFFTWSCFYDHHTCCGSKKVQVFGGDKLLLVFENLLVLVYSELHSKSCDQPYLTETGREKKAIGNFENIFLHGEYQENILSRPKIKKKKRKDTPFKHMTDIKFSRKRQSNERKQTDGGCSTARVKFRIHVSQLAAKFLTCSLSNSFSIHKDIVDHFLYRLMCLQCHFQLFFG